MLTYNHTWTLTIVHPWLAGLVQPVVQGDLVLHLMQEAALCGASGWGYKSHFLPRALHPWLWPAPGPSFLVSIGCGFWGPLGSLPWTWKTQQVWSTTSRSLGTHPRHSGTFHRGRVCSAFRPPSPGGRTWCTSHLWAEGVGRVRGLGLHPGPCLRGSDS